MVVTRFKPPAPKRLIHQQVPERLRRVQNACAKIYQSYVYNKTTDRAELEFSLYAQKFPENVRTRLLTLARARVMSPQQFEINASSFFCGFEFLLNTFIAAINNDHQKIISIKRHYA